MNNTSAIDKYLHRALVAEHDHVKPFLPVKREGAAGRAFAPPIRVVPVDTQLRGREIERDGQRVGVLLP